MACEKAMPPRPDPANLRDGRGLFFDTFARLLRESLRCADVALTPVRTAAGQVGAAVANGVVVAAVWRCGAPGCRPDDPEACAAHVRGAIAELRGGHGIPETVPFLMGTIGGAGGELDAALERVAAATPYAGLVRADGLWQAPGERQPVADPQRELGERFFRMWRSMSAASPEKLAAQAAKYSSAPRVRSNVLLDPGEFLVTSAFGTRRHPVTGEESSFHAGVDGALWNGRMLLETGICAWRGGLVVEAADSEGPAGTNVAIDHGGGLVSRYFHLEKGSLRVSRGGSVAPGAVLGWMGRTGRATGEHLHFQIERDGRPIDPLPLLSGG